MNNAKQLFLLSALFVVGLTIPCEALAEDDASDLFKKRSRSILQVRVLEKGSGSKESYGSGFYVAGNGMLITNYHVISRYVFHPERYLLEVENASSRDKYPAKLIAFDVPSDLAILLTDDVEQVDVLELEAKPLQKGQRLFSLGNPRELGFSIVEGTYNGLAENSYIEQYHFTGSINSGMSGGPTLTREGRVAGVNVASYSKQMSLLVPVDRVTMLINEASPESPWPAEDYLSRISAQLTQYQEEMMHSIIEAEEKTVQLGEYRVPTQLFDRQSCWSKAREKDEKSYDRVTHSCKCTRSIHLRSNSSLCLPSLFYSYYTSEKLNSAQIYSVLSEDLEGYQTDFGGSEEDYSKFQCHNDFVRVSPGEFRLSYCLRTHKKLQGLYDLLLIGSSTEHTHSGLLVYLRANALSLENVRKLAQLFLERLA